MIGMLSGKLSPHPTLTRNASQPGPDATAMAQCTTEKIPIRDDLLGHVRRYGKYPLSYSTLQPGLEYFPTEPDPIGFVAFRTVRGPFKACRVVLGDPVCSDANAPDLLTRFLAASEPTFSCVFVQIHEQCRDALADRGFCVNEMGEETTLDLSVFPERTRYGRRLLRLSDRYKVAVESFSSDQASFDSLRQISRSWIRRATVQGNEVRFLSRPFIAAPESDVRIFVARLNSEITAFAVLDPLYSRGVLTGYYWNMVRSVDSASDHYRTCILARTAQLLRQSENITKISLGFSPSYTSATRTTGSSRYTGIVLSLLYEYGNWLYNFRGLRLHKMQFHGSTEKVFVATRYRFPLWAVLSPFQAMNIQVGRQLWRLLRRSVVRSNQD